MISRVPCHRHILLPLARATVDSLLPPSSSYSKPEIARRILGYLGMLEPASSPCTCTTLQTPPVRPKVPSVLFVTNGTARFDSCSNFSVPLDAAAVHSSSRRVGSLPYRHTDLKGMDTDSLAQGFLAARGSYPTPDGITCMVILPGVLASSTTVAKLQHFLQRVGDRLVSLNYAIIQLSSDTRVSLWLTSPSSEANGGGIAGVVSSGRARSDALCRALTQFAFLRAPVPIDLKSKASEAYAMRVRHMALGLANDGCRLHQVVCSVRASLSDQNVSSWKKTSREVIVIEAQFR